jgi:hypothetical protein
MLSHVSNDDPDACYRVSLTDTYFRQDEHKAFENRAQKRLDSTTEHVDASTVGLF